MKLTNIRKNNPLSEVVWRKISSEFTPDQIQMFLEVNNACLEAMDESSNKIGEILSRVAMVDMDNETGEAYQKYLPEQSEEDTPKTLH